MALISSTDAVLAAARPSTTIRNSRRGSITVLRPTGSWWNTPIAAAARSSPRGAPQDKTYALGILNIRDPHLETRDAILRKIDAAAKFVPLENLALCPNCGFSGAAAGGWLSEDDQRRKLDLLVGTAAEALGLEAIS